MATASSGLAVAITIDASSSSICSIASGVVSFAADGTCVIDFNQAGNANYNAAPHVQQSVSVGQTPQSITFISTAPANATVGGSTYTVRASGGTSGNPVTFSIDASSTAGACSIAGVVVSFTGVGTCIIDANQAGNAGYTAAPQVQQSVTVGAGSQTISVTSTAPGHAVVAGATYTPAATASSGLAVAVTVDASSSSVCSIAAGAVSFQAAGTCEVDFNQDGNTDYTAAPQVQQSFAVGQGSQTISVTSTAPAAATVGGTSYAPTATATSGLAVAVTVDATASSVCSITAGAVSFTATGTCTLDFNQSGNANFAAAPQVQQSFAVVGSATVPGAPTIGSAVAGDAQATVNWSAPADTGGASLTGYVITPYVGTTAQTPVHVGVVLTDLVTGLVNRTTYTFTVSATDSVGTGTPSSHSGAVTPPVAQTPGP